MELLSIKLARSIWLFPSIDLNPKGTYDIPIIRAVVDRYAFIQPPDIRKSLADKNAPFEFGAGKYSHPTLGELNVDLKVYSDGFVADVRSSTDDAESFLAELIGWVVETFSLTAPRNINRLYYSEMYVSPPSGLTRMAEKLAQIAGAATEAMNAGPVDCTGLQFSTDAGAKNQSRFRFERAEGFPQDANRYFTSANATTAKHLALLQRMREIMIA